MMAQTQKMMEWMAIKAFRKKNLSMKIHPSCLVEQDKR
jgi:hypothetical protein